MQFGEKIGLLLSQGKIKEASTDLFEDIINAILGDPVSAGKIMLAITKSPVFIRERLFWAKIEAFLNGVFLDEDDCFNLRAKLLKDGENGDNPCRLVECIDRAETQQKIRYLINATRCLLTDLIDLPTYFRICHMITHTIEEDLLFLREHISESDLPYSIYAQGLLTSGLMYQSVIDGNGNQKYSFTPIAEQVDKFAVSYDDVERYPTSAIMTSEKDDPKVSLPSMSFHRLADKDIKEIVNEASKQ